MMKKLIFLALIQAVVSFESFAERKVEKKIELPLPFSG